jgi:hypothetical protein
VSRPLEQIRDDILPRRGIGAGDEPDGADAIAEEARRERTEGNRLAGAVGAEHVDFAGVGILHEVGLLRVRLGIGAEGAERVAVHAAAELIRRLGRVVEIKRHGRPRSQPPGLIDGASAGPRRQLTLGLVGGIGIDAVPWGVAATR